MSFVLGIALLFVASALGLSGLIGFSLRQDAARFTVLGTFVIPILALYALIRAMLPKKLQAVEVAIEARAEAVRAAEEEIETKRFELFGRRSQLWVSRRFESRYTTYLDQSVRRFKGLTSHSLRVDNAR